MRFTDAPVVTAPDPYSPAIADLDRDGDLDFLGAEQVSGSFRPVAAAGLGLEALFAEGRQHRDNRLVDLDGDLDLDLVANGYDVWPRARTRALLFWNEEGRFVSDERFAALDLRGHGETILAFDYDNDGDLDLFLPYYSHAFRDERSYLLENRGARRFVDRAEQAGVALRAMPKPLRVEGAQAADLDGDGFIDFYVASHLFLNRGDGTFTDVRERAGLPPVFDEGLRFLDWNADGALDIVLERPEHGPVLFEQRGTARDVDGRVIPRFVCVDAFPPLDSHERYGLAAFDLDHDGLEDVFVGSAAEGDAVLFASRAGERYDATTVPFARSGIDRAAAADFDRDGRLDVVVRTDGHPQLFLNLTPLPTAPMRVRVRGAGGLANQHGRIVRLFPEAEPSFVMTRIVDSGSGYMAQSDDDLLFASPYPGIHRLELRFATGVVTARLAPGDEVTLTPEAP